MADIVELGANVFNPAESVSCKMEMSGKQREACHLVNTP